MENVHKMWLNENSKLQDHLDIWSCVCVFVRVRAHACVSEMMSENVNTYGQFFLPCKNFHNEYVSRN